MTPEKTPAVMTDEPKLSQEAVIEQLKHAFAYDYLEVGEFETRLEKATATRNPAELRPLVADLPEKAEEEAPQPQINKSKIKPSGVIVGILSGITRKGRWKPPRLLRVVAFMGGVELDFTHVEFPPGTTEIQVFNMMGGTEIIVPPGVNVDASGFAIMGGFEDRSHQDVEYAGAPTLKIRGVAFMGGLEIHPPKQKLLERILKKFNLD